MMKTILVPLRGSPGDTAALETAYLAAQMFQSHLECLYVRPDPRELMLRTAGVGMGTPVITPELWTALDEEEQSRRTLARKAFDDFRTLRKIAHVDVPAKLQAVSAVWREVTGDTARRIVHMAHAMELVVLGRDAGIDSVLDQIGDVLVECGRPVILSSGTPPATLATTIAIAWKETPEAARAMTAAMPFLARAKKVVVISSDEGNNGAATTESAARLARALQWNGIEAQLMRLQDAPDIPGQILNGAVEVGADLLVMGAYSHSRAREFILGGMTRRVLVEATLPVLFCH